MHKNLINTAIQIKPLIIMLFVFFPLSGFPQEPAITIHVRGVNECKISLIPLSGLGVLKPIVAIDSIKNGQTAKISLPKDILPGEFVLRFDYKENVTSMPYPSEKRIIIGEQNLNLWTNPVYCNNPDSTWFQKDEKENTTFSVFLRENSGKKAIINLLQNFLLGYDDPKSSFFKDGIDEYEKRRMEYNDWITSEIRRVKSLFVSTILRFQYIPKVNWSGSEILRKQSYMDNYFDYADLSNPLILKTSGMKEWMDGYVNLYGESATTIALRDSLFTLAGKRAIEKAKNGDPFVYGWIVDYFFNGYESFNIEKGIQMLEPYFEDPDCLTTRRQEISKRLKGIETMVTGTIAPDIIITDAENGLFELSKYPTAKKYVLLLFWSADCSHCQEMVGKLYPWYQQEEIHQNLDVIALSLDETETEVQEWHQKKASLQGWIHIRASEGLRSKAANDYYLLGLPVMYLLDAKTRKIIGSPESTEQLNQLVKNH